MTLHNINSYLEKMLEFRLLNLHSKIENQEKFCCDDGLCIDSKYACDMSQQCRGLKKKSLQNCLKMNYSW